MRQDKHRALLAFPERAQLCFSVLAPMPSVKHSISLVITNPTNDPKLWSYRQCTVDEVCGAYCLTDLMHEAATLMTAPELVSKMSTTTPLLSITLKHCKPFFRSGNDNLKLGEETRLST